MHAELRAALAGTRRGRAACASVIAPAGAGPAPSGAGPRISLPNCRSARTGAPILGETLPCANTIPLVPGRSPINPKLHHRRAETARRQGRGEISALACDIADRGTGGEFAAGLREIALPARGCGRDLDSLPRLVGPRRRGTRLMLTRRKPVSPGEALRMGLVAKVFPR